MNNIIILIMWEEWKEDIMMEALKIRELWWKS